MAPILVIDDDPTIRLILMRILQGQGYDVILAKDGAEGIAQAEALCPRLVICDWMMPRMDGLEVCRKIKANPKLATTFFIMLTTRGAIEDRVRGLDTGADDFLSKPIELNELQARVRAGLRLHQLSQDLLEQKHRLELEFVEAAGYVRSLLPPPLTDKVTINSCFVPSRQLGGDCFDYYWLDPDYLVMYLLDVSGHGLGAALPSITILNVLRSQSLPDVNFYQPHDVLRGLNETFQMDRQNDKYFTMWYGVYNFAKKHLTYASAGHPPAILTYPSPVHGSEMKRLKTSGLPIGMIPDATFVSDRQHIPPGSQLYIFSDGIYDISPSTSDKWGLSTFIDLLTAQGLTADLEDILNVVREVNQVTTFEDDLSLLQVKFN